MSRLAVLVLVSALAACRAVAPSAPFYPGSPIAADWPRDIEIAGRSATVSAERAARQMTQCAADYAVKHSASPLTATEISEAAASACNEFAVEVEAQATRAEFYREYQTDKFGWSIASAERYGAAARAQVERDARAAALRALAEAR
jgi:hypothetical protein